MQLNLGTTRPSRVPTGVLASRLRRRNHHQAMALPTPLWLARAPTNAREARAFPKAKCIVLVFPVMSVKNVHQLAMTV